MPRVNRPGVCRSCQKIGTEADPVSWRGLCYECGIRRMAENNTQISLHRGPWFKNWRVQSLAALGVTLDDERLSA